jgi:xylan 1,4-beta-xylosidase
VKLIKGGKMRNIVFKPFLFYLLVFIIRLVNIHELNCQNKSQVSIQVNTTITTGSVEPVWNGIGGSLGLVLTPQGARLLQRIDEASPYTFYRRCWGITESGIAVPFAAEADYGSTNVYQVDENGRPFYDFTLFDQIFDIILSGDFIPIMHIGSMPDSLSSSPLSTVQEREDIDKYPPKDYNSWYSLVYNIVKHCAERYGKEKVARWKWELWNEPDLKGYWLGTEEEYFKLYDYTAAAVKDALPETQVGGNSVTQSGTRGTPFLISFIEHCLRGTNFKNGSIGAPLDFITFHLKGTNFAIYKIGNFTSEKRSAHIPAFSPSLEFILECASNNLAKIAAIPGTAGIPVYVTECDIDIGLTISLYENPNVEYRNTEYYPAFQCALAKEILDISNSFPANPVKCIVTDGLFYPGYRIFEGQRALFTAEEIEKPIFNAFRLLGKLGNERLQFAVSGNNNINGLATRHGDTIQIMVYNYYQDVTNRESEKALLSVRMPSSKSIKLTHYRIDENHSNAYSVWKSLGKPLIPNSDQMNQIVSRQGLELFEPVSIIKPEGNKILIPLVLPHHSVSLLVFEPLK